MCIRTHQGEQFFKGWVVTQLFCPWKREETCHITLTLLYGCKVERWGPGSIPAPATSCRVLPRLQITAPQREESYLERDLKCRALCLHLKTAPNADSKPLTLGFSCLYHKQSLSCQGILVPGSRLCDSLPSAWWEWEHQNSAIPQSFIWRFTEFSSSFAFHWTESILCQLARNSLSRTHTDFHPLPEFSIEFHDEFVRLDYETSWNKISVTLESLYFGNLKDMWKV